MTCRLRLPSLTMILYTLFPAVYFTHTHVTPHFSPVYHAIYIILFLASHPSIFAISWTCKFSHVLLLLSSRSVGLYNYIDAKEARHSPTATLSLRIQSLSGVFMISEHPKQHRVQSRYFYLIQSHFHILPIDYARRIK